MGYFWTDSERNALDYVVIEVAVGTSKFYVTSPGVLKKRGGEGAARNWTVQNGAGLTGAIQRFMGQGLAEFDFILDMNTSEHRADYTLWNATVEASKPGLPEKVFGISHPELALKGIDKCVFLNDPIPLTDAATGIVSVTYKCRQWRKPLAVVSSVADKGTDTTKPKPKSDLAVKIEGRIATLKAAQKANGAP